MMGPMSQPPSDIRGRSTAPAAETEAPMRKPAWLILPTYNEVQNLQPLVEAVLPVLAGASPGGHRVLVVDDNSPDGTGRLADALAAREPAVEVLHRPVREGLGPAYLAAFARALGAGASHVIQMDADFSHDPRDIARLLATAQQGYDLVLGSRYVPGGGVTADWNPGRRALSRAACWYARTLLGVDVRDLTGGFKCFRASALRALDLHSVRSLGYAFQVEVTYRAIRRGLKLVEVPIRFGERRAGESKMSPAIALEAAWRVAHFRITPSRSEREPARRRSEVPTAASADMSSRQSRADRGLP
jgi:dolichol-phosphate mannosyltransferase